MKSRVLFSNGCSMCYGSDLFDDPETRLCADNDARWRSAWPGRLAQRLGYGAVINSGYPGSSNDRILRTTIRWVVEDVPALVASGAEILAVIGWSSPMRREFYIAGEWRQLIPYHDYTDIPGAMLNRVYREVAWSDEESAARFATQIISVKSVLECAKIPYLFFNALETFADIDNCSGGLFSIYLPAIRDDSYFGSGFDGQEDVTQAGATVAEGQGHPDIEGHDVWAAMLDEHLSRRGIERLSIDEGAIHYQGTSTARILDRKVGLAKRPGSWPEASDAAAPSIEAATKKSQGLLARIRSARRRDPFIYE